MTEFNKEYDQRNFKITGSKFEYRFTVAELKTLLVELSEAYAQSRANTDRLAPPIQAFIAAKRINDKLAAKSLEAHLVSLIERNYALHKIDPAGVLSQGTYNRAHRQFVRTLHADSDLG